MAKLVVRDRVVAHRCNSCQGTVYGVCVDQGLVPVFILCLAPGCDGVCRILINIVVPDARLIFWEWYRPTALEHLQLKHTDMNQFLAAESGELVIRKNKKTFQEFFDRLEEE